MSKGKKEEPEEEKKVLKPYMNGNQFWRLRSKHGRDKIFAHGDMILEACREYLEEMYGNPQESVKHFGKYAEEKTVYHYRPPSWQRFCVFCGVNTVYFNDLAQSVKGKTDLASISISEAIATVRDIFFSEKFEAASAGLADPRLIGNVLGIHDLQRVEANNNNTNVNHEGPALTKEEVRRISKDLEGEY